MEIQAVVFNGKLDKTPNIHLVLQLFAVKQQTLVSLKEIHLNFSILQLLDLLLQYAFVFYWLLCNRPPIKGAIVRFHLIMVQAVQRVYPNLHPTIIQLYLLPYNRVLSIMYYQDLQYFEMGNQLFSETTCYGNNPLSSYEITSQNSNANVFYLVDKRTGEELVMKQFQTNSIEERNAIDSLSAIKIAAKSSYLTRLTRRIQQSQDTFCSNNLKMCLIFQRPYKSLRDEIRDRRLKNIAFSEEEIMMILKNSTLGLKELKTISHPHEHISSNNIFITKTGSFRLSDPWLNFESPVFPSVNHLYISPEKLSLANNITFQKVDWYSSDLFSIGMVVLEAISMEFMNGVYRKRDINRSLLTEKIKSIQYPMIRVYVEGLLSNNIEKRLETAGQIEAFSYGLWKPTSSMINTNLRALSQAAIGRQDYDQETINKDRELEENTQEIDEIMKTSGSEVKSSEGEGKRIENRVENPKLSAFTKCHFRPQEINILINSKLTLESSIDRTEIVEETIHNKSLIEVNSSSEMSQKQRNQEEKLIESIKSVAPQLIEPEQQDTKQPFFQEEKVDSAKLDEPQYHLLTYDYQTTIPNKQNIEANQHESQEQAEPQDSAKTPPKKIDKSRRKYNSTIMEVSDSQNQSDTEQPQIDQFVFEKYQIGSKYEGYKRNGMRNGKGRLSYHDGGYYDGDWKDDKMDGQGKLFYPSGKIAYEGQWKDDEFHGLGKVFNDQPIGDGLINYQDFNLLEEQWLFYEGNLISDTKQGQGRIHFLSGEIFEGEFVNDRMQGRGKFYSKQGVINGLWKASKLVLKF